MTDKRFGVSTGKGFHMTFSNGWTVSVQWGPGNYCDNQDMEALFKHSDQLRAGRTPCLQANSAEIAAWDSAGCWYKFNEYEQVKGWCKPDEVLAFMNTIAGLPARTPTTHEELTCDVNKVTT